jgi:alpha-beta hydrolase superfamily lysophospholipase
MGKKDQVTWHTFDQASFEKMDEDLTAVAGHFETNKAGSPASWILVGSSLGATLVVRHAAKREGDVAGVALISPGASLRGLDVYKPFGSVLRHPNLLMAGSLDSVSQEPVRLMARMSKTSQRLLFEARGHSAEHLGEERWEMWDDLADWVETRVRESTTVAAAASVSSGAPLPTPPPGVASSGP